MRRLGFAERYQLGAELAKELEPVCSYQVIAKELGISKQNAYTETVLALGKFAFYVRERLGPGALL